MPIYLQKSHIKWTEEEDRRLCQLVSENAGNIRNAFRCFTEEYPHRTFKAIEFRWYDKLKNATPNICMITVDKNHKHINSKNLRTYTNDSQMNPSLWNKILNLLFKRR